MSNTETASSTTPTERNRSWASFAIALMVALGMLFTACSGDQEFAGETDPIDVVRVERPDAPAQEAVLGAVADRFGVEAGSADEAEFRARLAAALVPPGTDPSDEAFIDALAARLGPEFAGVRDLDVLIDALVEQLGPDVDTSSPDAFLAAIEDWALTGVIYLGGANGNDVIRIDTSFEEAEEILGRVGAHIDLIDGLRPIELRNVELAIDAAARSITLTTWVPAPISGNATVTIDWFGSEPNLELQLRRDSLLITDLLPELGEGTGGALDGVGLHDVELLLDNAGLQLDAMVFPSELPGVDQFNLPAGSVPASFGFPGLGFLTSEGHSTGPAPTIDVTIPLGALDPVAQWNTERSATVTLTLGGETAVRYGEQLRVRIGDDEVVFRGEAEVAENGGALTLAMDGEWTEAFGLDWLTLADVELSLAQGDASRAEISGTYTVAGKTGTLSFALESGDDGTTIAVTGTLDDLTLTDLRALADTLTGGDLVPAGVSLPDDLFSIRDIVVSFESSPVGTSFSFAGTTEILGQTADAMFALLPAEDGGQATVVAVQPRDVRLADLLPVLDGNEIVGDLRLPETAFVLASADLAADSDSLSEGAAAFFATAYGSPAFELDLPSGISLAGSIPGGVAAPVDDLKELLGMDRDAPLVLSGTIPVGALTGSAGIEDFELNALLPEMRADGEWFISAQLGFRITGQPSVGVVGSITVDIQGDIQTFEVEASIAKTASGVSLELVGRLDGAWRSPFDIEWLTLNEVVLKLGFDPARGVTIGFLGDLQIGTKDIRGAMAITISPSGAPTNFLFEAASEAGIGLGDLADLYAAMSGEARPPVESVLPDVEIRNIDLRFAPQGDPDLGVEQGFKVAGELWMSTTVGGPLELLVGVDLEISDTGIRAAGFLAGWDLGPLAFDDASVLLEVSASQQRFAISGGVTVLDSGVNITLDVSRTAFSFETSVLLDGGRAGLRVEAAYDLRDPSFTITAVMDEQFIENLDDSFETLLGAKLSDINGQIKNGKEKLKTAQDALAVAKGALSIAKDAVAVSGCGWPFSYLCDAVDAADRKVDAEQAKVTAAQAAVRQGEALLEKYDLQLTLVGAEFSAGWAAFDGGNVTMSLIVEANGNRLPAPVNWDFNKTIDANVDGIFEDLF